MTPPSASRTLPALRTGRNIQLLRPNVAVAQVRGFAGRERVLLLERREAVLGVSRHPGVLGLLQRDVVHPGRVAGEDLLLGGAVGVAKGCEPVLLLHVLRDFGAGPPPGSATAASRTTACRCPTGRGRPPGP